MNTRLFTSALASGILALFMSPSAVAADVNGSVQKSKANVVPETSSNPASLELHFTGAQRVSFYDAGTFNITRADGTTWKYRPYISQDVNGKRKYLVPGFRIVGTDRVAISVPKIDESAPVMLNGKASTS